MSIFYAMKKAICKWKRNPKQDLIDQLIYMFIKNRDLQKLETIYDGLWTLFEYTPLCPYREIQLLDQYNGPYENRIIGYRYQALNGQDVFFKFCTSLFQEIYITISTGIHESVFDDGVRLEDILEVYEKKYDVDYNERIQKCLFIMS